MFGMSPLRKMVAKVTFIVFGVGFILYGSWSYLDGRTLITQGVEARVTHVTSFPRAGHTLHYRHRNGEVATCNVSEDPPHERVVYDPAHPWRCRVPAAVGKMTQREMFLLIFGPILLLCFFVMVVFDRLINADPLL
jgi:hypothetical protein